MLLALAVERLAGVVRCSEWRTAVSNEHVGCAYGDVFCTIWYKILYWLTFGGLGLPEVLLTAAYVLLISV